MDILIVSLYLAGVGALGFLTPFNDAEGQKAAAIEQRHAVCNNLPGQAGSLGSFVIDYETAARRDGSIKAYDCNNDKTLGQ